MTTRSSVLLKSNLPVQGSVHTYPDLLLFRTPVCKATFASCKVFSQFLFNKCNAEQTNSSHQTVVRPFLSYVERTLWMSRCTTIIARFDCTHDVRLETEVNEVKKRWFYTRHRLQYSRSSAGRFSVQWFQIYSVFKNFHSGQRIQKVADWYVGFTGYEWTEGESATKMLRIKTHLDKCGWASEQNSFRAQYSIRNRVSAE